MPEHASSQGAEIPQPLAGPASFLYEVSSSGLTTGMHLLSKRSAALADYFARMAQVRQPGDFVSLQVDYVTRLMDDYVNAAAEAAAIEHAVEREARRPASEPPYASAQA